MLRTNNRNRTASASQAPSAKNTPVSTMVLPCPHCVSTGSVGVKTKFGKFVDTIDPGFTCYICCIEDIRDVSLAVQQVQCSSDCKTKDNVTLTVSSAIQYHINRKDIQVAVFDVANPLAMMQAYVDDVLRSELPSLDLDDAYSAKETMVARIRESLQASMEPYGYSVINVLITDLRPEASVLRAMNEINASRRAREAAIEKGEADKILQVKAAEADAESKYLSGVGVARMREAITSGFKTSIQELGESGLTAADAVHMMIVTQYLDTLKDFAVNGKGSIMVPHGPGAAGDIEEQVRRGFIGANALEIKGR
uniref:Band 7 domain-containing protein n=1 Tax=Phaeomonas parva TaxID=124430 RepID=A0A7S1UF81_9STRA